MIGKAWMAACLLMGAYALWQGSCIDRLRLRVRLTEQRAERAESEAAALREAGSQADRQISALQTYGRQCEDARADEAAQAAERRAILGQTGSAPTENHPAQGGIVSPPYKKKTENEVEHGQMRRAVADRLNRPL